MRALEIGGDRDAARAQVIVARAGDHLQRAVGVIGLRRAVARAAPEGGSGSRGGAPPWSGRMAYAAAGGPSGGRRRRPRAEAMTSVPSAATATAVGYHAVGTLPMSASESRSSAATAFSPALAT